MSRSSQDLLPDFLLFVRDITSTGCSGYIHHVVRNEFGGSLETPTAHFVAYIEEATENQPRRWEVNLFLRNDVDLDTGAVPRALGEWLLKHSACIEPMVFNIHQAKNTDFLSFGDTWLED